MSNTIDEKVVEMKFDNKNFETNVKTTMTSLDRLKEKLQLRGSEKSFQAIDSAAKSVSFDSLISNVEYLRKRFSVMGIAGMQVVQNLTSTVMASVTKAKNFVEQAISGGGLSRAMKLDQANFKLMGLLDNDAKQVASIMKDVDYGVSGTAYSLDAAASVAAQLAASGMRAGDGMKHALLGISGLAAMTGSSYEDIGRIYTQISGQGRMMGDQLLQLSGRGMNVAATLAKALNTTEADIRDKVSKGEIDFNTFSEVMFKEYGQHAKKANETVEGAFANVKSALAKIGANFYEPLIKQNGPLVELLNTIRLKINDIKEITLPFVDSASKGVSKLITYANTLVNKINPKTLFSGLTSKWDNLMNKISEAGVSEDTFTEKLKEVAKEQGINIDALLKKYGSLANIFTKGKLSGGLIIDTLKRLANVTSKASESTQDITDKVEYFNDVVSKTIRGDFGNGEERIKALTAANYDYAQVQALVNKVWERNGHNWSDCTLSADELTEAMASLSDKEAESLGLTEDQIKTLRNLAKQAEETGTPISELITSLNKPSGKELLIESFQNAVKGATQVAKAFKQAFSEMFVSTGNGTENVVYKLIERIHDLSEYLVINDEKFDKLKRTIKGFIALIQIVSDITSGGLKIAFKLISGVLKYFDIDILSVTATIGDFLVKFHETVNVSDAVGKALDAVLPHIAKIITNVKKLGNGIKEIAKLPSFEVIKDKVVQIGNIFGGFIKKITAKMHFPTIEDFLKLLENVWNIGSKIGEKVVSIGKKIGTALADAFGFVDADSSFEHFLDIFDSSVISGILVGILLFVNNVKKAVSDMSGMTNSAKGMFGSLGKMFNGITSVLDSVRACFEEYQKTLKAKTLLTIASAIAILTASIVVLSLINPKKLAVALGAITTMATELMAAMWIFNKVDGDYTGAGKAAILMVGMSAAILILSSAVKKMSSLSWVELSKGLSGVTILLGELVAVSVILGNNDTKMVKGSVGIVLLAEAIKILSTACINISGLSWEKLAKGLTGITVILGGLIAASMVLSENETKMIKGSVGMILLSAALKILTSVCSDFGAMSWEEIAKGLVSVSALLAVLVGLSIELSNNGAKMTAGALGVVVLAGGLEIVADVCKQFSNMEWEQIGKGLAGVAGMLAALTIALKNMPKNILGIGVGLLAVAGALTIVSNVVTTLGDETDDNLSKGIISIAVLLAAVATALNCMNGTLSGSAALLVASAALAILCPVVKAFGDMKITEIGKSLLMLAGVFTVLGVTGLLIAPVVPGLLLLGASLTLIGVGAVACAAGLLLVATSISTLAVTGATQATAAIGAISVFVSGLTSLIPDILAGIGDCAVAIAECFYKLIVAGLNTLIEYAPQIVSLAISLLVKILDTLSEHIPELVTSVVNFFASLFQSVIDALKTIDTETLINGIAGIGLLTALMVALAACALLAPAAMVGVVAVGVVVAELTLVISAIGALAQLPGLKWLLSEGAEILPMVGKAIGEFLGALIGAFAEYATDHLPNIATNLSDFITNLSPFIDGLSTIEPTAMEGAKALAETLLLLTAASLLDSLAKFLGGGVDYDQLAKDLKAYGKAVVAFSNATKGKVDGDSVTVAANAGKVLAELQKSIPRSGGWAQKIMGEKDMSAFSDGITAFGDAIVAFSNTIVQNGGIDKNAVDNAAKCGEIMAALNDKIPAQGGVWQCFIGEKNLSTFGSNIKDFGNAMVEFSNTVSSNGAINDAAITNAKNIGDLMVQLNKAVPEQGGFMSWITGSTDLDDFGENIVAFGGALVNFSNNVSGKISDDAVNAADNAGQMMVNLQKQISGLNDDSFDCLDSLGSALETWGSHLSNYSANISGIDTAQLGTVTDEISTLYSFVSQMTSFDASGLSQFTASLNNIGTISLDNFVSAFGDAGEKASSVITTFIDNMIGKVDGRKQKWETSGRNAMVAYRKGISDKKEEVSSTASDIAQTSIDKMSDYRNNFYNVGQYLIEGMANGIDDASNKAVLAVRRMAKKLPQIAKIILQIHSPSKVFDKLGEYVPEGFAGGVIRGSKAVYDTIKTMSNTVIDKAGSMMSLISDVLSLDLDYEPTITPVVDMSKVTGSMDTINSMLNKNPLMFTGVSTNAMNSIVKRRNNQNGNSDVIEAIDRLAKNINQTPGNTYNVNGITYDDGSNIASAVEQIVRAATIGRRV
mgnify:FL=1